MAVAEMQAKRLADPEREIWTVEDVAEYLQISEEKVRVDVRKKVIPGFQLGALWRFKSATIRSLGSEAA